MKCRIASILLLMLSLVLCAQARARDAKAGVNVIPRAVSSPHIAWADGLHGPRLRVLFIAPRFTLRDAVEVAQRLPMAYETAALWDTKHLGYDPSLPEQMLPGASAEEVTQQLRTLLERRYDVIVMAHLDLAILPEDVQRAVLEKVAAGAGLLLAYHHAGAPSPFREFLASLESMPTPDVVVRGIGETGVAGWNSAREVVHAAAYGLGRVVQLDYPGQPPRTHCLVQMPSEEVYAHRIYFDNSLSLVLRAMRWAARRESPVWISRLVDVAPAEPAEEEIPPGLTPEFVQAMKDSVLHQPMRPYHVEFSEPARRRYRAEVQILRPGSKSAIAYDGGAATGKSAQYYPIDLLAGPGEHMVNVWLRDGKGVLDWFTQGIHIEGWPQFTGLECSKTFLLPNDTLEISVDVRPLGVNPGLSQNRVCTIYARATDPLPLGSESRRRSRGRRARRSVASGNPEWPGGRLVAEVSQAVSGDGGHVVLELGFADLIAPLITLEVFAVNGSSTRFSDWQLHNAYRECRYFAVRQPPRAADTSLLVAAGTPQEYNAQHYLDTLGTLGADTVYAPAGETAFFNVAQAGLGFLPELTRLAPTGIAHGAIRQPCLSNPAYRERQAVKVQDATLLHWAGGTRRYSLGNGNCLCATEENVCQSPECLAGFRQALEKDYRDLYELNARWGTLFRSWDEVVPCDADTARSSGNFAAHIDFRRYMDTVFTGFHDYARARVRSVDRQGEVGFRALGGNNAMYGYDWRRLAAQLDFLVVEPDAVTVEKLRAYQRPAAYSGLAFGDRFYLRGPEHARWFAWYAALHQIPALWCMTPFGSADDAAPHAALCPDARPAPAFDALAETVRELKQGFGALLLGASRDHTGIAIYDSPASRCLNDLDQAYGSPSPDAERFFCRLFEALGYQYDFVDEQALQTAAWSQYRVLVLPMARALSDAETASIRSLAARGVTLVADVVPGTHDAHGTPRTTPALDMLFGVGHGAPPRPAVGWLLAAQAGQEERPGAGLAPTVTVDASVKADGAEPMGIARIPADAEAADDAPVWLVQRSDACCSLLLNHAVPGEAGDIPPWRNVLEEILTKARCQPILGNLAEKRNHFDGERFRFLYGRANITALLASPSARGQKVSLLFPGDAYVYDMRAGALLRRARATKLKLAPGGVRLYASLPYRVTGLSVACEQQAVAGRRLPVRVAVKTAGGRPGAHLVHLDLVTGGGQRLRHYAQNVFCRHGVGNTYIPLALNETPGDYWLVARDVLTGLEETASLRIMGSGRQ